MNLQVHKNVDMYNYVKNVGKIELKDYPNKV